MGLVWIITYTEFDISNCGLINAFGNPDAFSFFCLQNVLIFFFLFLSSHVFNISWTQLFLANTNWFKQISLDMPSSSELLLSVLNLRSALAKLTP